MLIAFEEIHSILARYGITITGAFHIGAHECEELDFYNRLGLTPNDIIWIDALPDKVMEAQLKGIPNVYNAVITDTDNEDVTFNIANNGQSSSVLQFCTHSVEHPSVVFINTIETKSMTIDTFFERNSIDASTLNFWNMDIQGAELLALKGATTNLDYATVLYLEVNEKELYKNCGLVSDIDQFLTSYGFHCVLTCMTIHGWGDALYIKLI